MSLSQKWLVVTSATMTSRGWIFTLHNPTEENIEFGRRWIETPECIGISAGREICPTTGRPHIQGYVRLNKSVRKGHFRKIIGPNANGAKDWYMKEANADWVANAKYTQKDADVLWYKCPPSSEQGCRTDLAEFKDAIKRRAGDEELFEKHLPILAKYPRLEGRLKRSFAKMESAEFRRVECAVYFGPGGTGKSKKALYDDAGMRLPDTYIVPDSENLKWWMDYDGESTIVINEMDGSKCKYSRWKEICDGHQMMVETKGEHTYAKWTKVIMTTNVHPNNWWDKAGAHMNHAEFARRVGSLIEFK